MKNLKGLTFAELNMELINRGIVYESYDQSCYLEAICSWGFAVITYSNSNVIDPVISFYDWKAQIIINLDINEYTEYTLRNGYLKVKQRYIFSEETHNFMVNLNDGAAIHVEDVIALLYKPDGDDERIIFTKGKDYILKDGEGIKDISNSELDIIDYQDQGFELLDEDYYQSNVDVFNDVIAKR